MNKMDITIGHIEACKNYNEAYEKITDPIKGFGYKLTKNEVTLCLYYARLYFKKEA